MWEIQAVREQARCKDTSSTESLKLSTFLLFPLKLSSSFNRYAETSNFTVGFAGSPNFVCSESHKFSIDGMKQRVRQLLVSARVAGRVVTPNLVGRCAGTPNFSVGDVHELLNLVRGVRGNPRFSVLGLQELLYYCAGGYRNSGLF